MIHSRYIFVKSFVPRQDYTTHRFMFSHVHEVLFGVDDGFFDKFWGGVNHVPEVLDERGARVCLRAAETQARTAAYTGGPAPHLLNPRKNI